MLCSKCVYYAQTNTYTKCMLFNMYVNIAKDYKCKGNLFAPKDVLIKTSSTSSNVKQQIKK